MTKEELDNYFEISDRYQQLISELKNMKIDWETDLGKIDYSKLRNFPIKEDRIIKMFEIKYFDLNYYYGQNELLKARGKDFEYYLNLIELIKDGVKIIPPCRVNQYCMKDNQRVYEKDGSRGDGSHRMAICRYLGLQTIPFITCDEIYEHSFTRLRWTFEYDNKVLSIVEKNNPINTIELNMREWHLDHDADTVIFRRIQS